MASPTDNSELTPREAADLSALADGTIDPARRDEVRAWVEASPQRTALFERERRVVELLRESRGERAPDALRARIEAARAAARPARRAPARWRIGFSGALATAVAAIAVALVLILPSGAPSVFQAAAIAVRGPVAPAPALSSEAPKASLAANVGDVYFPNWSKAGWHAVGQRTDTVDGRRMLTVFYQWQSSRIAYTIVDSPVLADPSAHVSSLNGVQLRTFVSGGRLVVTWHRSGHTCILSSASGVPASALQSMAATEG